MQDINLSLRFINALRQLPQYAANTAHSGPLTHVMTGARVLPKGDLTDEMDTAGILEIQYPGGHSIDVNGYAFFTIALKEAAEIEISTSPDDFGISDRKLTPVQARIRELGEHLRRKHSLE
ncbi:hypothetical protein ACIPL1_10700 [Pseudomonas sp. NPDC090202]|uniref:hypothetical protein n=1 Tax=Pseudomonas sp. NPDC090202 TaxID=3364476 RepID=UPI0038165BA4